MARRHTKAERQQLKKMLSDAIRVLCQSTVRYNVQLSVEALIGVTIDDGEDVLIVSLNDVIGKHTADTTFGDGQYYDDAADDDQYDDDQYADEQEEYMDEENGEFAGTADADQEYEHSAVTTHMPYGRGTVVKEELMLSVMYGPNRSNQTSAASATARVKTEPYVDNAEQYSDESLNLHSSGIQHSWPTAPRPSATVSGKSRMAGFGIQKQAKSSNPGPPGAKRSGKFGVRVSQDGSRLQKPAAVGKMSSVDGEDAVAQITLFTCGTCGAQMQSQASFVRHKKSHTSQQLYNCQGCGKVIRRSDNLLSHQRRCRAYLMLLQQGDPGQ